MANMYSQAWRCLSLAVVLLGMLCLTNTVWAGDFSIKRRSGKHALVRRQADQNYQQQITQMPTLDAINAVLGIQGVGDANGATWAQPQNGLIMPNTDDGDDQQVEWFGDVPFSPVPTNGDWTTDGSWKGIPDTIATNAINFSLRYFNVTDEESPDAPGQPVVQPYYINDNYDPTKIKRVLIVFPGKPRDSWKYATLFSNALDIVQTKNMYGVQPGEVLIVAPAILNTDDKNASDNQGGSLGDNWVIYQGSNWESGGASKSPTLNHSVTFYGVLDQFTREFMNQTKYPNLKNLVYAGHSMGGQTSARYALLRKPTKYEPALKWWIGNPGSWGWVSSSNDTEASDRPMPNPPNGCPDPMQRERWPYGIGNGSSLPKYARKRYDGTGDVFVKAFLNRTVHYSLGLLDNGAGSTKCEAQYQGGTHLQRGSFFVQAVGIANTKYNQVPNNALPPSHNLTYIAGVSHQDYPMIAATQSLDFLFGKDYDTPRTDRYGLPKIRRPKPPKPPKPSTVPPETAAPWESTTYRTVAWVVLVICIVILVVGFFVFDRLFRPNTQDWDRDYWETTEAKQSLL